MALLVTWHWRVPNNSTAYDVTLTCPYWWHCVWRDTDVSLLLALRVTWHVSLLTALHVTWHWRVPTDSTACDMTLTCPYWWHCVWRDTVSLLTALHVTWHGRVPTDGTACDVTLTALHVMWHWRVPTDGTACDVTLTCPCWRHCMWHDTDVSLLQLLSVQESIIPVAVC
jgi:hypothetical protein